MISSMCANLLSHSPDSSKQPSSSSLKDTQIHVIWSLKWRTWVNEVGEC
jgi:hypothetical protein